MNRVWSKRYLPRVVAVTMLLAVCAAYASDRQVPCSFAVGGVVTAQVASCVLRDADTRLIIVGTLHGTVESPALVRDIVAMAAAHRPVRVGLEMPVTAEPVVRAYIDSNGDPRQLAVVEKLDFWKFPDGRATSASLALIESLQSLRGSGHDVDFFAMEPSYPSKQDMTTRFKEAGMAAAIRAALVSAKPDTLVVALMGNYHSRVHDGDAKSSLFGLSVPEMLADHHPMVLEVQGVKGAAWNCQNGVCGVHAISAVTGGLLPTLTAMPAFSGAGHGVSVYRLLLPTLTASQPIGPVYR